MQHLDTKPSAQKVASDCKLILLDTKQSMARKFGQIPRKDAEVLYQQACTTLSYFMKLVCQLQGENIDIIPTHT